RLIFVLRAPLSRALVIATSTAG
ncbi:MAG: hypothetical protein QOI13_436, partial [Paraburkholderia sp.]|nr:hypothetical protein [Paraburkholderia sp.]